MSTPPLVLCSVVVGLVLLFGLRPLFSKLVGPVLGFDAIRTARRSRLSLLRAGYAFVILLVLFLVYVEEFDIDVSSGLAGLMDEQQVSPNEASEFAARFFHVFLSAQFLAVLVLTPMFTAGAIAEEREKGTLALLLTSDLFDREIIVGKLVSRLGHLVLLLLAGVPILSLLQLLGGVDPALLAGGFGFTLLLAVGVGALSLLCSVVCRRTRDAGFYAYVWIAAYQLFSGFYCGITALGWNPDSLPEFLLGSLASGNLFLLYYRLTFLSHAGTLDAELPILLLQNLVFHGGLTLICLRVASAELRRYRASRDDPTHSRLGEDRPGRHIVPPRPLLEEQEPMVWKECHLESGVELPLLGDIMLKGCLLIFAALATSIFCFGFLLTFGITKDSDEFTNSFLQVCLPLVAGVGMLSLALRAAVTIAGERERQTLEGLLTTDLTSQEILVGKLWGCVYQLRHVGTVLAVLVTLGVLTGGIGPIWAFLVVLTLAAHGSFAVSLGMYCSVRCRTTLRATILTGVLLLGVGFGHWLLFVFEAALCRMLGLSTFIERLAHFHHYGLTPPIAQLSFLSEQWHYERVAGALLGMVCYAVLAAILWRRVQVHFARLTGRR